MLTSYSVSRLSIVGYTDAIMYYYYMHNYKKIYTPLFIGDAEVTDLLPNEDVIQNLVFLFCCNHAKLLHEPCCNEDFIAKEEGPRTENVEYAYLDFWRRAHLKSHGHKEKDGRYFFEHIADYIKTVITEDMLEYIKKFTEKYINYTEEKIKKVTKETQQYKKGLKNTNNVISHSILLNK